jgi:hypothetical protein
MGFFKRLFENKERCRDFVRSAYKNAFADAGRGLAGNAATPHVIGLYNALANFYAFRGMQVGEMEIWPELLPFLQMKEDESLTALVEYSVFRMWPNGAVISRVRPQLNRVLRGMNTFDEERKASLVMAYALAKTYMDTDGKSGHPISWFAMLDEDVHKQVAALVLTFPG